jgi:hypothetical protein
MNGNKYRWGIRFKDWGEPGHGFVRRGLFIKDRALKGRMLV